MDRKWDKENEVNYFVIPAQAGIQSFEILDSRFHGNDTGRIGRFRNGQE
jgi:hypothetical protein